MVPHKDMTRRTLFELALNFVAVIKWTPAASDIDTVLDSLKVLDRNFQSLSALRKSLLFGTSNLQMGLRRSS
jgi:hypothetical protein